jgi:hypothetical protein
MAIVIDSIQPTSNPNNESTYSLTKKADNITVLAYPDFLEFFMMQK